MAPSRETLATRLARLEERFDGRVPDNFRQEWGRMLEMTEQVHSCLYKNGLLSKVHKLENKLWYLAGFTIAIGGGSVGLIKLLGV